MLSKVIQFCEIVPSFKLNGALTIPNQLWSSGNEMEFPREL